MPHRRCHGVSVGHHHVAGGQVSRRCPAARITTRGCWSQEERTTTDAEEITDQQGILVVRRTDTAHTRCMVAKPSSAGRSLTLLTLNQTWLPIVLTD